MDYKKEMRQLIDIVKHQSFDAPLEQTFDDMKTLATAVKDLSDRIEMRVRKSNNSNKMTNRNEPKTRHSQIMKAKLPRSIPPHERNNPNDTIDTLP